MCYRRTLNHFFFLARQCAATLADNRSPNLGQDPDFAKPNPSERQEQSERQGRVGDNESSQDACGKAWIVIKKSVHVRCKVYIEYGSDGSNALTHHGDSGLY